MKVFKVIVLFLTLLFIVSCSKQKEFDKIEWKNWIESEATIDSRWLMHKDLLRKYPLKGVSKDSIIMLLGEFKEDNFCFKVIL